MCLCSKLLEYRKPVILMAMAFSFYNGYWRLLLYTLDLDRFTYASCFRDSCDFYVLLMLHQPLNGKVLPKGSMSILEGIIAE